MPRELLVCCYRVDLIRRELTFDFACFSDGKSPVWYGPGKAANCGGVAVSGLEMSQNSQRTQCVVNLYVLRMIKELTSLLSEQVD